MTEIKGKIRKGFGKARECLPLQIKFLKDALPEILAMYQRGTLNVELENPVHFLKYDFVFRNMAWREGFAEDIGVIKAGLLPLSEKFVIPVPCFLYFPATSTHRSNPFMLEIITQELDLKDIQECSIHFSETLRAGYFFGLSDGNQSVQ